MKNGIWMVLLTTAALGLAACGGDADGSDERDEATAQTMADEANAASDMSQELPEGVTMAMVNEGKRVFEGAGICTSCHGPSGEGVPNLGGDLTDDEWLHSDGSYEGIVETVMDGVTAEASSTGVLMPARAGTNISDDQVRAAAAYVWTLSK